VPALDEPTKSSQKLPKVNEPEQTNDKESDDESEDEQAATNVQIRNSPIHGVTALAPTTARFLGIPSPTTHAQHPTTQPTMSTTMTRTAQTTTATAAAPASGPNV
jgi:hypothetical protein